jgi:peptide-methionine (R)-S-oxide reductase
MRYLSALILASIPLLMGCMMPMQSAARQTPRKHEIQRTEAEWKKLLTAEQYHVLREEGTEAAYSGKLWNNHAKGTYACAGCGLELFSSDTKFDSGTGWPSFWKPIDKKRVDEIKDYALGMERIEVECHRCGGHLGHVFDDGPEPTGLRYCMNSAALTFNAAKKK